MSSKKKPRTESPVHRATWVRAVCRECGFDDLEPVPDEPLGRAVAGVAIELESCTAHAMQNESEVTP